MINDQDLRDLKKKKKTDFGFTPSKNKSGRMTTVMTNTNTPLLLALMDKRVKANVIDLDHYRIRGGMVSLFL